MILVIVSCSIYCTATANNAVNSKGYTNILVNFYRSLGKFNRQKVNDVILIFLFFLKIGLTVRRKLYERSKKVREKSRECHNHKPQPFQDPKRKRKPTNLNKHKPNKRTKSTKISSLFPKRGNRNTKRTEKYKNKMTHGKTYNKSPRRINHKATNTGNTALERSVEQSTGGGGGCLKHFYS